MQEENIEEKFYTTSKDGDLYLIPLVKPIQVISTIGYGKSWIIKLPYQQLQNIRTIEVNSLTVIDSIIVVYAGLMSLPGETTEAWFLIETKNKTEKLYTTEDEFIKGIKEVGISKLPQLYEINELYRQFKEEGILPWVGENI